MTVYHLFSQVDTLTEIPILDRRDFLQICRLMNQALSLIDSFDFDTRTGLCTGPYVSDLKELAYDFENKFICARYRTSQFYSLVHGD